MGHDESTQKTPETSGFMNLQHYSIVAHDFELYYGV